MLIWVKLYIYKSSAQVLSFMDEFIVIVIYIRRKSGNPFRGTIRKRAL